MLENREREGAYRANKKQPQKGHQFKMFLIDVLVIKGQKLCGCVHKSGEAGEDYDLILHAMKGCCREAVLPIYIQVRIYSHSEDHYC